MRHIALSEAPEALAVLVAEVERTGEPIVLTRDGHPAASLEPAWQASSALERIAALADLAELRKQIAARGSAGWSSDWAELKTWAEDGRG